MVAACLEHQATGFSKNAGTVPCGRSLPLTTGHGVVRVCDGDGVYGWAPPDTVDTIDMAASRTVQRSYFTCDPDAIPGQSLAMLVESTAKPRVHILHICTPDNETNANVCNAHGWRENRLFRYFGWELARKVVLLCS